MNYFKKINIVLIIFTTLIFTFSCGSEDSAISPTSGDGQTQQTSGDGDSNANPNFSVASGQVNYGTEIDLTLPDGYAGWTVLYTIDGSEPAPPQDGTEQIYSDSNKPKIEGNITLKVIAYNPSDNSQYSQVVTNTYTIPGDTTVSDPVFTLTEGTYQSQQDLYITCLTEEVTIRYTVNGDTPRTPSHAQGVHGTVYTAGAKITISSTQTVKAVAYRENWTDSNVTSATYTIDTTTLNPPTITDNGDGTYTITSDDPNAKLKYNYTTSTMPNFDNLTPIRNVTGTGYFSSGNSYTITVNGPQTIKAIAFKGEKVSAVATKVHTVDPTNKRWVPALVSPLQSTSETEWHGEYPAPEIGFFHGGTYGSSVQVTISTNEPGAKLRYKAVSDYNNIGGYDNYTEVTPDANGEATITIAASAPFLKVWVRKNSEDYGGMRVEYYFNDAPEEPIYDSRYNFKNQFEATGDNMGFGPHFKAWLETHGYWTHFSAKGGFGGFRSSVAPKVNTDDDKHPVVILVHGNGSRAAGSMGDPNGWYKIWKYLRERGWNNSEIYAVNHNSDSLMQASMNNHRQSETDRVKMFIKAVLEYIKSEDSQARKVVVIGHSLGVTIARKAMYDGNADGSFSYSDIKRFISIAGGNHGLATCYMGVCLGYMAPTCSGDWGFCYPPGYSSPYNTNYFIGKLNSSDQGDYQFQSDNDSSDTRAYVIMSRVDEIVGMPGLTEEKTNSARLRGAYGTAIFTSIPYGHFNVKDGSIAVEAQYKMIKGEYSPGDNTEN